MSVYLPEFMQKLHAQRAAEAAQLSRRGFIKLTGLAGGGLVLAVSLGRKARESARAAERCTAFDANPYVQIQPDGKIVLFAKNPEVGQGVKTSLPMIVAEELDADWQQVEVRQSVIDAALYGPQFAGGSLSIPMNFDVAAARRRDRARDARRRGRQDLERAGGRAHDREQHRAPCGQQPQRDVRRARRSLPRRCRCPTPRSVALKPKQSFRLLGTRVTGVDNAKLVRGEPLFGIDQRVPGHGVRDVRESAGDRRARRLGQSRRDSHAARRQERIHRRRTRATRSGSIRRRPPCCPASRSSPTPLGPRCKRRKRCKVQWDEAQASSDSWTGAVARSEVARDEARRRKCSARPATSKPRSRAGKTVEALYTYHYVSHADLEPQNCTAWFKGDSIEIWAPTQTPQNAVDAVAALLGLPKEKVTLHQLRGGGGFGRRLANDSVCEAALISKQAGGIPVKVQWTREDDMAFDYYRPGGFHALKAAGRHAGKLSAWQNHFITFTHGRQSSRSALRRSTRPSSRRTCSANQRMLQSMIPSKIPTGPWRAPGSNVIAFCVQGFLHECAVAANRDYVDFLVDLMGEPRATSAGSVRRLGSTRAAPSNVIKAVAERAGWGKTMPAGRALGLAFHFSHQGHFAEVADVSVDASKKVTVHKVWVVADIGPIVNLSSAENQCQGSVIDALSTAMGLKITFENGRVEQTNFHQYPIVRIDKAPEIDVHFLDTDYPPTGCGEPAFPPAAPAIANAIFAATGQRVRTLPFRDEGFSV